MNCNLPLFQAISILSQKQPGKAQIIWYGHTGMKWDMSLVFIDCNNQITRVLI